jgi:hypothetical protein
MPTRAATSESDSEQGGRIAATVYVSVGPRRGGMTRRVDEGGSIQVRRTRIAEAGARPSAADRAAADLAEREPQHVTVSESERARARVQSWAVEDMSEAVAEMRS